ncbi:MAG: hypothetical protein LBK59_03310 [Bifidobacteriaceae bacterium]|jgi:hypothetical protein|nr:hypothetical protein [Bifidobacteriaceae bacterium]
MKRKVALCAAVILAATMSLGATAAQAGAPIYRYTPALCGFEGYVFTPDGEPAVDVTVTVWGHEADSEPDSWNAYPEYIEMTDETGYFFAGESHGPGPQGVFTVEFGGEGWSTMYAPGVDSPEDAEFYGGGCHPDFGDFVIGYPTSLGQ